MPNLYSLFLQRRVFLQRSGRQKLRRAAVVLPMVALLASFVVAQGASVALAGPKKAAPKAAPKATGAGVPASKAAVVAARYPLDPICPWGRIGDGQGILIRCLEQQEAIGLLAVSATGAAPVAASQVAPAPAVPPAPVAPTERVIFRSVGKAKPDSGSLPEARPQLSKPKHRYIECVEKHGGVDGKRASVVVKFLVRERGRAEGVSVKSRKGMSAQAAKCIAEVVDRRYVGFPEAPIVGVTLEIRLGAESIAP